MLLASCQRDFGRRAGIHVGSFWAWYPAQLHRTAKRRGLVIVAPGPVRSSRRENKLHAKESRVLLWGRRKRSHAKEIPS
eukprot:2280039-Pyramimonas_sp.AAC.1